MELLHVQGLTKYFGGMAAVIDLDFTVLKGEIMGLIGPNGAGKTTVFNLVTGFCPAKRGKITFKGQDITGFRPNRIAKLGLVRTFQSAGLFDSQTVFENVLLGYYSQNRGKQAHDLALEILNIVGLVEVKNELVANLPHGHRRVLGMAIALSADPELLLLDEPLTGMNSEETTNMINLIDRIRCQGISIMLVEHDMKAVMSICKRIMVLNFGRKLAEGTAEEIQANEEVIRSYLGFKKSQDA
jgi:branched-chain amino acid transport system ATP-binding protein